MAIGRKATDRIRDRAPLPQGAASRRSPDSTVQEGGGAEANRGRDGGPGPCASGGIGD